MCLSCDENDRTLVNVPLLGTNAYRSSGIASATASTRGACISRTDRTIAAFVRGAVRRSVWARVSCAPPSKPTEATKAAIRFTDSLRRKGCPDGYNLKLTTGQEFLRTRPGGRFRRVSFVTAIAFDCPRSN